VESCVESWAGRAGGLLVVVGLALALGAGRAGAVVIQFHATDLPVVGSADRWQYEYVVSDASFASGFGFSILFPVGEAKSLQVVPTHPSTDWDVVAIQPDTILSSDGRYDAQALVNGASLGSPFTVSFDWLAQGIPGSQAFEIYDPSFATIGSGQTVPVPEASGIALLMPGLAALAGRRRSAG